MYFDKFEDELQPNLPTTTTPEYEEATDENVPEETPEETPEDSEQDSEEIDLFS